ncbi:MAG: HpcH/HpaI aldolase family protein [Armatimonadota bacterium]
MRPNPLKRKLLQDQIGLGLIMLSADPHVVGISAGAGYDYVMPDMEHTGLTLRELEGLVRAADAAGIACVARVPGSTKADILGALEAGVHGIMVPAVESAEEAAAVVRAARYGPEGARGVYYLGYGSAYGATAPTDYFRAANEELLIIVQIETAEGVARAREIAAVPGVDCLLVGPGDLTQSLGVAWQFGHDRVWSAIQETFQAARTAGKIAGIMPAGLDHAEQCVEAGARMLIWGPDLALFQRAAQEEAGKVQERLGWTPRKPNL